MKKALYILALVFVSCTPPETCDDGILNQDETEIDCGGVCALCPIQYPSVGAYGINVLNDTDINFTVGTAYSMKAILPVGTSLQVIVRSDNALVFPNGWFSNSSTNWAVANMNQTDWSQTFTNVDVGVLDLNFTFNGDPGSASIEFYENGSSTITHSKAISWN